MKKILVLFMILTTYIFSQSWNDIVTTSISESNMTKMDLFTNKDGNHVITQNTNSSNSIKYYLLNSAGTTVIRSATIETEGSALFPNISGDNNKVYLVYKLGTNLKAKESTDAGASWSTISIAPLSIGSNTCNGVDIVYDYQGLHVVYATQDSYPDYETHYYKLNSSNAWVDYKNVTDGAEVGGFPTVSVSANRVHVAYNTGHESPVSNNGIAKSRDKNNTTWETAQTVNSSSSNERIHAGSSKLFDFYYKFEGTSFKLCSKTRDLSGTTWSTESILQTGSDVNDIVSATTTSDGKTHIVYSGTNNNEVYRSYDGSAWSSEYSFGYPTNTEIPIISSAGNDLFITLRNAYHSGIQYRQYDAIPVAPYAPSTAWNANNYAVVTWPANMEPDIASYKVYKMIEQTGWGCMATINYSLNTPSYSWVDEATTLGGRFDTKYNIYYKVLAKDIANHESNYSPTTTIYGKTDFFQKKNGEGNQTEVKEYGLQQNYPNPFNPSTEINYQIPSKGFVTLKVYDVLGNEVSTLVNEWQEAGSYNAQFTTSGKHLASGMYFYTLNAGKFTDTKKLILMK
ncbi:MAG: T9SS type A sorting domain-containing protein [Ignavibacteria bacterium]|nr:T9SS type A sorting domain-containing protein [Ignavibacteria bacterium]